MIVCINYADAKFQIQDLLIQKLLTKRGRRIKLSNILLKILMTYLKKKINQFYLIREGLVYGFGSRT